MKPGFVWANTAYREVRQTRSCAFPPVAPPVPIGKTGSTQKDEGRFFTLRTGSKDVTGSQAADHKTHPLPVSLLARQMEELTRLLRGQVQGTDKNCTFAQIVSQLRNSIFGHPYLNVLRLWQIRGILVNDRSA